MLCKYLSKGYTALNSYLVLVNTYIDDIFLGLAHRFSSSVHYHQGRGMAVSKQKWGWRS